MPVERVAGCSWIRRPDNRGARTYRRRSPTFLGEGHFARHVARMRKLYVQRRALLVSALAAEFGDRLDIECPAGGLQLIARLPEGVSASMIARRAAEVDIVARPMAAYQICGAAPEALHLGFAAVPNEHIQRDVATFHAAVSRCL